MGLPPPAVDEEGVTNESARGRAPGLSGLEPVAIRSLWIGPILTVSTFGRGRALGALKNSAGGREFGVARGRARCGPARLF